MKVILTETVKNLGNVGEIHKVSEGFGRNFLIPRKMAIVANEGNKSILADQQKALAKKMEEQKSLAEGVKKKLNGFTVRVEKRVGGSGRLFGTVTTSEISEHLKANDIDIEKRLISIESPIKQLGTFDIKAKLFQDVVADFKVQVQKDAKQVEEDKKAEKLKKEAKAKKEAKKAEAAAQEKSEENSEETSEEQTEETAE